MNVGQELSPGCSTWRTCPGVMHFCSPGVLPEPEHCEAVVTVSAVSAGQEQLPQLSTQGNFPPGIQ